VRSQFKSCRRSGNEKDGRTVCRFRTLSFLVPCSTVSLRGTCIFPSTKSAAVQFSYKTSNKKSTPFRLMAPARVERAPFRMDGQGVVVEGVAVHGADIGTVDERIGVEYSSGCM
jgi:hypothetical protein